MKLHIEKSLLQDAITTVIRAVPSKSTMPVLEGILLGAQGETLTVSAYNMKLGIRTRYNAEIREEGRIVVNAKLFQEIIRKMPNDTVAVECGDNYAMKLTCGDAQYNVMAMNPADYPEMPETGDSSTMEVKESVLRSMISDTVFAVSADETRPVQTGELFEVSGGKIHIVACDGFRLAVRSEETDSDDTEFVVPGYTLSEVERLCGDSENTVKIAVGDRHVMFYIGETEIVSRRLEGSFLDWKNAIPKNQPIAITVNAKELSQSIERVSVVVSEKLKSPVRCKVGSGEISLSTKTVTGAASDRCKVNGDGKDLEIGFNGRYLGDAVKFAPDDELRMRFDKPTTPTVITPTDGGDRFVYMVLPVRLKQD